MSKNAETDMPAAAPELQDALFHLKQLCPASGRSFETQRRGPRAATRRLALPDGSVNSVGLLDLGARP
jgi:hypothetical protein